MALVEETGMGGSGIGLTALIILILLAVAFAAAKRNRKANPAAPDKADEPEPAPAPGKKTKQTNTRKMEQERRKNEYQKKKEGAKKEGERLFRITAPVVFIGFSIAIGWPNLVDFISESTGVNATASNFFAFIFAFGTMWAGTERYMASRKGNTKGQFTALLWALIAIESTVHLGNGLLFNQDINWYGALFLAILSPTAGIVFEMAIKANRSDIVEDEEKASDRKIPESYRTRPLLYLKLHHTKNANPGWNVEQIVTHVRAKDAARAVRHAWSIQRHRNEVIRWLRRARSARGSVIKALVDLNPYGAPTGNPKEALVHQLNLTRAADAIIAAEGHRDGAEAILRAFDLYGGEGVQNDAGGVQAGRTKTPGSDGPAGVQNPPSGSSGGASNSDPVRGVQPGVQNWGAQPPLNGPPEGVQVSSEDAIDRAIGEILGRPAEDPVQGPSNSADGGVQDPSNSADGGVQDPSNSADGGVQDPSKDRTRGRPNSSELDGPEGVQVGRSAPPSKVRRKGPVKPARRAVTKKTTKKSSDKEAQVSFVYAEVVRCIDAEDELPTVRWVKEQLGVSQGTAGNRLNEAKEAARSEGHNVPD